MAATLPHPEPDSVPLRTRVVVRAAGRGVDAARAVPMAPVLGAGGPGEGGALRVVMAAGEVQLAEHDGGRLVRPVTFSGRAGQITYAAGEVVWYETWPRGSVENVFAELAAMPGEDSKLAILGRRFAGGVPDEVEVGWRLRAVSAGADPFFGPVVRLGEHALELQRCVVMTVDEASARFAVARAMSKPESLAAWHPLLSATDADGRRWTLQTALGAAPMAQLRAAVAAALAADDRRLTTLGAAAMERGVARALADPGRAERLRAAWEAGAVGPTERADVTTPAFRAAVEEVLSRIDPALAERLAGVLPKSNVAWVPLAPELAAAMAGGVERGGPAQALTVAGKQALEGGGGFGARLSEAVARVLRPWFVPALSREFRSDGGAPARVLGG